MNTDEHRWGIHLVVCCALLIFHKRFLQLAVAAGAAAMWTACAVPGAPMPPSLELPKPVTNLRATRVADKVTLTWTVPTQTTDKAGLKLVGTTRVCRGFAPMTTCETVVAELPAGQKPEFTDTLTPDLEGQHATGFAVYALEVQNSRGKSAGLSNQIKVPLAPTLPPPEQLLARATPEGAVIGWSVPLNEYTNELLQPKTMKQPAALDHSYRLYRIDKDKPDAQPSLIPLDTTFVVPDMRQPNLNVRDATAEWEKTYIYWVTTVTTVNVEGQPIAIEGDPSPRAELFVHDVFPPAAPTGVQAVFTSANGANFIDLTWAPNLEPDLAGYNIYRREEGSAPVKLNRDVVKAPAFRDTQVTPGHRYFYSATAVDLRNNESQRSAETSEQAPQP